MDCFAGFGFRRFCSWGQGSSLAAGGGRTLLRLLAQGAEARKFTKAFLMQAWKACSTRAKNETARSQPGSLLELLFSRHSQSCCGRPGSTAPACPWWREGRSSRPDRGKSRRSRPCRRVGHGGSLRIARYSSREDRCRRFRRWIELRPAGQTNETFRAVWGLAAWGGTSKENFAGADTPKVLRTMAVLVPTGDSAM